MDIEFERLENEAVKDKMLKVLFVVKHSLYSLITTIKT